MFVVFIWSGVDVDIVPLYFSDLNLKLFRVANKNIYFLLLP